MEVVILVDIELVEIKLQELNRYLAQLGNT